MTCALCHSYTTCKYSIGRFAHAKPNGGMIITNDAFLACPQSFGGVENPRGTFFKVLQQWKPKSYNLKRNAEHTPASTGGSAVNLKRMATKAYPTTFSLVLNKSAFWLSLKRTKPKNHAPSRSFGFRDFTKLLNSLGVSRTFALYSICRPNKAAFLFFFKNWHHDARKRSTWNGRTYQRICKKNGQNGRFLYNIPTVYVYYIRAISLFFFRKFKAQKILLYTYIYIHVYIMGYAYIHGASQVAQW